MTSRDDAASLLKKARESADDLEARLYLAAAVQQVALGVGARSVVTGGTAVDFYAAGAAGTSEAYPAKWQASGDIDVVVLALESYQSLRNPVLKALEDQLGLKPRYIGGAARVVVVPDFAYGLEIVGEHLNLDPKGERVFTVLLEGKYSVTLRGPEDVILSYAESGWHTRHTRDWERALAVFSAMRDHLDLDHLIEGATARGQRDVIERVIALEPLRVRPDG